MKSVWIILTLWLCAGSVRAQITGDASDFQHLSDELVAYPDEDTDYESLHENLAQILASPYDLNRVTREELQLLHLLNDEQINSFLEYRR